MRKVVSMLKKYEFILKNLDCANCAREIEETIAENKNFQNVVVNFNTLKLSYEAEKENRALIEKLVKSEEPDVEVMDVKSKSIEKDNKTAVQILRLMSGSGIAAIGFLAGLPSAFSNSLILIGYLILLYRTIGNAIKIWKTSKSINENFLVTISCFGAYLIGEMLEGLMVILLYEIGKILEDKAVHKTRKSISDLMNIQPEYANLKTDSETRQIAPEDVKIGDTIIIKQGEKIPLDGIVVSGEADLDTSSLTGESALRKVKAEQKVLSGSINVQGMLEVEVTEKYENSTASRILELVENATDKKAKAETFVNKAAKIYTPIVIGLAICVALFLPWITQIEYSQSIYRALIFLVVSCPCAIAISVPLSYFSGIGKASKLGILIKGSDYLDALKDVKQIVFDKTGTLTKGEFAIKKVKRYSEQYTEKQILELAVLGESFSNHPIAKSVIKSSEIQVDIAQVKEFEEIAGKGLCYKIQNKKVWIGNKELIQTDKEEDGTAIFIKVDEELVGSLVLSDQIKEGTKEAIQKLNSLGIQTKMFTGDSKQVAEEIAKELGIKEVKSEMLPTDKYNEMEKILKERKHASKVAFVGDGINDSPVLARSDIGISMGGVGSQAAIEASDVVIMTDNLNKIVDSIQLSKRTSLIIKQNLVFALGIKILVLILSTVGISNMWQAIFADVGVTLLTIMNTLRILSIE